MFVDCPVVRGLVADVFKGNIGGYEAEACEFGATASIKINESVTVTHWNLVRR